MRLNPLAMMREEFDGTGMRLRETFRGVTPEQAAADVRKFIGALKEKSLLADD